MRPSAFSTSGTVRGPHCRASKTDLQGAPPIQLHLPPIRWHQMAGYLLLERCAASGKEQDTIGDLSYSDFSSILWAEVGIGLQGENEYILTTLDVGGSIQYVVISHRARSSAVRAADS